MDVETSKKRTKCLKQTLPLRFLSRTKALLLQGFLNLLVMNDFQAGVRKGIHS
jgi:hypothetical protein